MPDDKFDKSIKYYEEHKDELRAWVLLNKNYGGLGALNGPVIEKTEAAYERFIITHSFRHAREIVQGIHNA